MIPISTFYQLLFRFTPFPSPLGNLLYEGRFKHELPYISGEVGVVPDGTVPENIEAQAEACWQNIIAILADPGMDVEDLVKITTFLVRPEDVAAAGAARAKHFADARPGSATIIVKALVNPAWLIEIEAVAAARRR